MNTNFVNETGTTYAAYVGLTDEDIEAMYADREAGEAAERQFKATVRPTREYRALMALAAMNCNLGDGQDYKRRNPQLGQLL